MPLTGPAQTSATDRITISAMTEHDLLEVVEIEENSGLSRWGWSAYYAELQGNNRGLMLVARLSRPPELPRSHNIAGYIVAKIGAEELHINNVAVREEHRRRGLGRELLNSVLKQGKSLGAKTAFLELRAGNSAALALYEQSGFLLTSRRAKYYSDPVEDALVMVKQFL